MRTLTIAIALLVPMLTFNIGARMKFKTLEVADGLSSNHVNIVMKDSRGAMWFGTSSGLNRYDGYSVTKFPSQPGDSTRLHDNYIQDIQEDADGFLWINAGDRFSVYDPRTNHFHKLNDEDYAAWGISSVPWHIKPYGQGLWITAYGQGVLHLDKSKGITHVSDPAAKLGTRDITGICTVPERNLVVAVDDLRRIYLIDATRKQVVTTTEQPGNTPRMASQINVWVDREGWVWVYGMEGTGVYDLVEHRWINNLESLVPLRNVPVKAIGQDEKGTIWVGYDNDGIDLLDKKGNRRSYRHDPSDSYSLGNNSVLTIYRDDLGGMWIGTYKKGISVYNPSEFKFDSTPLDDVNCLALMPGGYVLAGTDTRGIMKVDPARHTVLPATASAGTHQPAVVCITPSRKGGAWVGTYNDGLKYFDGSGFTASYGTADSLASNNIWAITENPDGTLFLGTLGGGLQLFDPATKSVTTFNTTNSGLESNYINTLCMSPSGKLYMGTTHGIAVLDPVTRIITSQRGSRNGLQSFGNQNINQLMFDSRGILWVVTREGLNTYDPASDKIQDIELRPDEPRLFVLGVAEDTNSSMWVSVDGELININVSPDKNGDGYNFQPTIYDRRDGIQAGTFNQRSFCKLPSGEILAGGLYGIAHIVPDEIHYNEHAPSVRFTALSLDNRPVESGIRYGGRIILPQSPEYLDKIELNHDQTDITLSFATDNYIHPDRTTYLYRLTGLNEAWNECPPGSHSISYANLSPGDYTLELKAVNNDGVEGPVSSMSITVHPPVWGTVWAKIIYVLIAAGLLLITVKLIRTREHRRFATRRKEELAKNQEELNQLKFKFFTNISHELRTPLTLILSPVESMLKENPEGKNLRRLTTIKSNAERLLYLVNQLLDFRKNEMSGLAYHPANGDLVQAIGSVCEPFSEQAERQNIRFTFNPAIGKLDMAFDNDKMSKTVINLISNAFKYTPDGGEITVTVDESEGNAVSTVADTGQGISDADKLKVFERFYQTADNDPSVAGSGIGLSLVQEYVKLHQGEVTVEDNTPCGTLFRVTIPIRRLEHAATTSGNDAVATSTDTPPGPVPAEASPSEQAEDAKPKVLLADDNYDLVEFLKDELSDSFDITGASDGADALKKINSGEYFDLIISDLIMPNMDGIELSRRLKSDSRTAEVPLILLTARQDVQSVVEGLTIGADDYVTKPFDNQVLRLRMQRLIGLRRKGMKRPLIEPRMSEVKITSLDEKLVEKAVKYVEDNISRSDLSVEELSRELGMSRVHLYKKLLTLTGKTPIEFIRVLRLKRAAQYLRESQLNVSEIAYRLGFNNPKYFSKYFKDEFGISPSEYQSREGK